MPKVNLDALIPREDLKTDTKIQQGISTDTNLIKAIELKSDSFFFSSIRKPDFQRTTWEWSPEKVCGLIEGMINEDLIPSIILWRSQGNYTFVIDGSHRLSAIAAWVNDDYGDGFISRAFSDGIEAPQIRFADKTRTLIKGRVGEFKEYEDFLRTQESSNPMVVKQAMALAFKGISVQWLNNSDAKKAEDAFLKINQLSVKLSDTELELIGSRKKANALAARAIINNGSGHQYWREFPKTKREEIIALAKNAYKTLFTPMLRPPVKTLNLPTAGKIYTDDTLQLIVKFVNIVNGIEIGKRAKKNKNNDDVKQELLDDTNGDQTIKYLRRCNKIALLLNSNKRGSLGLHPAVYFYSLNGRYKPGSFHAIVALIIDLEKNKNLKKFINVRHEFESFLIRQDELIQWFGRKARSTANGYIQIKDFFLSVIDLIEKGFTGRKILREIRKNPVYRNIPKFAQANDDSDNPDFTEHKKSQAYIRLALPKEQKCSYCKGYIPSQAITVDHRKRKSDGGKGRIGNDQLMHAYCNNSMKN